MGRNLIVIATAILFSPLIALEPSRNVFAEDASSSDVAVKVVAVDGIGNAVSLPQPPESLAEQIKAGKVRFEFYDPDVVQRKMAGETRYEFKYTYKSRSSWRRIKLDRKPAIRISIHYSQIKLERSHRVFLPEEMIQDDFFSRRLTLHEFDHVAISCDARLPALLESMLNEQNAELVEVLDEEKHEFKGSPSPQDLARISKRLVKEASDKVFDDLVSIVAIRYQELDRISENGITPLSPADRYRIIESPPSFQSPSPQLPSPELPSPELPSPESSSSDDPSASNE